MILKKIRLVLENCDSIAIDGKYIAQFVVDDIKTSFQRIAVNAIIKMETAHIFIIEIHRDANVEREPWGCPEDKYAIFDRLTKWDDITQIEFELDSGDGVCEEYRYFLDWTGESDMENEAQKSFISKSGHLYIVVADGKDVEDFFDMEYINEPECMDLYFEMLDIGDANFAAAEARQNEWEKESEEVSEY